MEEIRYRTQGRDETIDVYVAMMSGLFSRLACLIAILNVADLIKYGFFLDATKASVEGLAPPPAQKSNLLETDLAYVGPAQEVQIAEVRCGRDGPRYWNCKRQGHLANPCHEPRKCFGCGQVGVFKRDCRNCRPAANARQTQ